MTFEELVARIKRQNFGPNDSVIVSSLLHPVSAAEQAGRYIKRNMDIAAGVPDVYDNPTPWLAPSIEQQAEAATNIAGLLQTGAFASGAAPKSAGGLLGTFIGPKAKTWNKEAAEKAAGLLDAGAKPEAVWQEHMTGRMPDGSLFQEIPDNVPAITQKAYEANTGIPADVYDILPHDQLKAAYSMDFPTFLSVHESYKPNGSFNPNKGVGSGIQANAPDFESAKSTLLHELQHAIQDREGWARGGTPSGQIRELAQQHDLAQVYKVTDTQEYKQAVEAFKAKGMNRTDARAAADKQFGLDAIMNRNSNDFEAYQRLAGEAQARATQARMNMNPDERRANYPLADGLLGDIPLDQLIFKYGDNGPAMMVPPSEAEKLKIGLNLPQDGLLSEAVANTPGAKITDQGLLMALQRNQAEAQMYEPSVRGGVFYLPEGAAQAKHYSTGKNGYGGTEKLTGETLLKNPLFVKGATGGKAPEAAIDALKGKGAYQAIRDEALKTMGYNLKHSDKVERVQAFLDKHAPELSDYADYIVSNSKQGNQLPYALQEAAVASAVRNAGHDAVLGYSKGKAGPFLSELFDVRESHYPGYDPEDYQIWPELYK